MQHVAVASQLARAKFGEKLGMTNRRTDVLRKSRTHAPMKDLVYRSILFLLPLINIPVDGKRIKHISIIKENVFIKLINIR